MTRRIEVHRGRNGTSVNGAAISVVAAGAYIHIYPSAAAFAIAKNWTSGYLAAFEIDDETGQPTTVHFTPAPAPGRGFRIRQGKTGRPHFYVPTIDIGTPDHSTGIRPVQEIAISDQEISVRLPFSFRLNETPTTDGTAATEVANDVVA